MRWWTLTVVLALPLAGCECSATTGNQGSLCDREPRPRTCDQECDEQMPCASGFYCGPDGTCTADCAPGGASTCLSGQFCRSDGRCIDRPEGGGDGQNDGLCANVMLDANPVTPTVILIVDQSGSMTAGFGGSNRWNALRDSLLDEPNGLIPSLQDQVRFGLALYSARAGDNDQVQGECPLITDVPFALDNFAPINAVYGPADPIDETPTGDAIDAVLDSILNRPDRGPDPVIFILATDGEPDRCEEPNPQRGQDEAIAATERAFNSGIRTFIISVGEGVVSERHLQDMANAGLGRGPADPDADFFVAGDDNGLRTALTDIVGGVLSCEVVLEGTIDTAQACTGEVILNGRVLPCDDPNGWQASSERRIEILGDACTELQAGRATLEASFPCNAIIF
ncbi:MAG: vWA domain-containing protein [Myxococcota bacterium]